MKLTNKYNLPQTFVNVLNRPTYTKGKAHLSATEIINSPRIVQLKKTHWDDLEEDVADKVWAIFGTAIHAVLELGKDEHHIIEQRLHANVDGWDISGAIDLQRVEDDGIIVADYKTTGAWAVMNEKSDWEQQLNIYAWLVEKVKKVPVKKVEIIAIIRDWNRRDAQTREGYPEAPIKVIDVPLWSFEKRESFIKERIHLHSNALFATETSEALPECSPSEMWEKPAFWAVRKIGNKRATAVFDTQDKADAKIEEMGKGYEIEYRPGERTRCANFCQVRDFCNQWKEYNID
jgi:PD-(D/E)XK nuclease superfamily/Uncharacterized protein conserved in bacteria (DUF2188)